jgi:isopentenyl diphosphate isomerase/L-lactate dehydrogenase-like FMN-dependent dehydrogenase
MGPQSLCTRRLCSHWYKLNLQHEAEKPVAKVAGELNLPYCLSTAGSTPIKQVGAANESGGTGPRFFQLYMPHDDELTLSLLNRAWNSGFDALILTTDTWIRLATRRRRKLQIRILPRNRR